MERGGINMVVEEDSTIEASIKKTMFLFVNLKVVEAGILLFFIVINKKIKYNTYTVV